ncbi:ABC transporter permease [Curtobacterium sp. MCBD17_035]|uniref:ABC transporter permease n=1 Tax=Curtobacterium sp. MCBD17_035 TaxID=2175673 RepID=UPI000DA7C10F|nr:ABC transporter permease [Curtobacterium sp. MCBD17_035]WIB66439.1 ABC transporter permease [Curtobacterium sp. MCBD17_035]
MTDDTRTPTTAAEPDLQTDDRLQDLEAGTSLTTETADDGGGVDRWSAALRGILGGSVLVTVLAVVLALVASGILIAITDKTVTTAMGYFFARPSDTFVAIGHSVGGAFLSMFDGAVYDPGQSTFSSGIASLWTTIDFATPLIVAGLGVAVSFRSGLFNIGGQGQILVGAASAAWFGYSFHMPAIVHIPLTVVAGIVGGAIWGGIVGVLKSRTGAHEVIVTIMLNYVALYLLEYGLGTKGLLQAPGSANPQSSPTLPSAVLPTLIGGQGTGVDIGILIAIAAVVFTWWLMNRSTLGFRFRTVGENPRAARVAGMDVGSITIWAMVISGALVGIAGAYQVQAAVTSGYDQGIDAGIGFDAITVALLGRSKPWGVFWAGLLFGALKAGGSYVQASQNIPIDIVSVIQALIVLFIAAPPLVRAIFRIPQPGARRTKRKAVAA